MPIAAEQRDVGAAFCQPLFDLAAEALQHAQPHGRVHPAHYLEQVAGDAAHHRGQQCQRYHAGWRLAQIAHIRHELFAVDHHASCPG